MKRAAFVLAIALFAAAPAEADQARSSARFEKGTRLYQVGEYQKALEEFKAGHLEEPDPSFLYNIAQCHRQLGQAREAATVYRRFLNLAPDTPLRADVERRIAELDQTVRQQAAQAQAPAAPATRPPERRRPARTLSAEPRVTEKKVADKPSRWPVWVGGLFTLGFAGGATALALSTNQQYESLRTSCGRGSETMAGCSNAQIDHIRTRGRVVNALMVLAGVSAVATGIAFFATSDGAEVSVAYRF